jgi:hypothetical protein
MGRRPGTTPENFEQLKTVRARTQFGSGALRLCECTNRKTGLRCRAVAATGSRACRFHGGTAHRYRSGEHIKLPTQHERAYHCSLARSDDLWAYLREHQPSMVKKVMAEEFMGARGRKIHALLNGKKI